MTWKVWSYPTSLAFAGRGAPPSLDAAVASHALIAMGEYFGRQLVAIRRRRRASGSPAP